MCSSFIACFADFGRPPCGAHDFGVGPRGALDSTRAMRGPDTHNFSHATRGSSVPTLPAALVTSLSGNAGATDTASTSAVAIGEGHTDGTSDQPSSDDHVGEAGLPASSR
jgi:hypothetical protein